MKNKLNGSLLSLLLGPILFFMSLFLLPADIFEYGARGAIGLMIWMIVWWIFRPVYISVTALLPVAINAIFSFIPMGSVIASYSKPIFFLLLGTNVFAIAWQKTGVDKRVALRSLLSIGTNLRKQVFVWYCIATIFSVFLANTVVTATLVPIAISMLAYAGEDEHQNPAFILIMLAIAWGAGLGGFGTPLGGGMNLVTLEYIQEFTGIEYTFGNWAVRMLPILAILTLVIGGYLVFITPKGKTLSGANEYLRKEFELLGKITRDEVIVLGLFVIAVMLTFTRPLYSSVLPNLTPFFVFFVFGLSLFFIPSKNKDNGKSERIITWEFASQRILWSLLILFSGGLALGDMMIKTGAASNIASFISSLENSSPTIILSIFVLIGIVLANISSNTAACAILMPIVLNTSVALGFDVVAMLLLATVAANSAYILPTSVRAIPSGYGLAPSEYLKKGVAILLISFLVIIILGNVIFSWIPVF